jgi:hypothetical protein
MANWRDKWPVCCTQFGIRRHGLISRPCVGVSDSRTAFRARIAKDSFSAVDTFGGPRANLAFHRSVCAMSHEHNSPFQVVRMGSAHGRILICGRDSSTRSEAASAIFHFGDFSEGKADRLKRGLLEAASDASQDVAANPAHIVLALLRRFWRRCPRTFYC